jgi:hypothetical protein
MCVTSFSGPTGWGRTGAGQPGATVLQQARLPVISELKCRQHMGSYVQVTRQMVNIR